MRKTKDKIIALTLVGGVTLGTLPTEISYADVGVVEKLKSMVTESPNGKKQASETGKITTDSYALLESGEFSTDVNFSSFLNDKYIRPNGSNLRKISRDGKFEDAIEVNDLRSKRYKGVVDDNQGGFYAIGTYKVDSVTPEIRPDGVETLFIERFDSECNLVDFYLAGEGTFMGVGNVLDSVTVGYDGSIVIAVNEYTATSSNSSTFKTKILKFNAELDKVWEVPYNTTLLDNIRLQVDSSNVTVLGKGELKLINLETAEVANKYFEGDGSCLYLDDLKNGKKIVFTQQQKSLLLYLCDSDLVPESSVNIPLPSMSSTTLSVEDVVPIDEDVYLATGRYYRNEVSTAFYLFFDSEGKMISIQYFDSEPVLKMFVHSDGEVVGARYSDTSLFKLSRPDSRNLLDEIALSVSNTVKVMEKESGGFIIKQSSDKLTYEDKIDISDYSYSSIELTDEGFMILANDDKEDLFHLYFDKDCNLLETKFIDTREVLLSITLNNGDLVDVVKAKGTDNQIILRRNREDVLTDVYDFGISSLNSLSVNEDGTYYVDITSNLENRKYKYHFSEDSKLLSKSLTGVLIPENPSANVVVEDDVTTISTLKDKVVLNDFIPETVESRPNGNIVITGVSQKGKESLAIITVSETIISKHTLVSNFEEVEMLSYLELSDGNYLIGGSVTNKNHQEMTESKFLKFIQDLLSIEAHASTITNGIVVEFSRLGVRLGGIAIPHTYGMNDVSAVDKIEELASGDIRLSGDNLNPVLINRPTYVDTRVNVSTIRTPNGHTASIVYSTSDSSKLFLKSASDIYERDYISYTNVDSVDLIYKEDNVVLVKIVNKNGSIRLDEFDTSDNSYSQNETIKDGSGKLITNVDRVSYEDKEIKLYTTDGKVYVVENNVATDMSSDEVIPPAEDETVPPVEDEVIPPVEDEVPPSEEDSSTEDTDSSIIFDKARPSDLFLSSLDLGNKEVKSVKISGTVPILGDSDLKFSLLEGRLLLSVDSLTELKLECGEKYRLEITFEDNSVMTTGFILEVTDSSEEEPLPPTEDDSVEDDSVEDDSTGDTEITPPTEDDSKVEDSNEEVIQPSEPDVVPPSEDNSNGNVEILPPNDDTVITPPDGNSEVVPPSEDDSEGPIEDSNEDSNEEGPTGDSNEEGPNDSEVVTPSEPNSSESNSSESNKTETDETGKAESDKTETAESNKTESNKVESDKTESDKTESDGAISLPVTGARIAMGTVGVVITLLGILIARKRK